MLGVGGKDHRAPTSDLESTEDKVSIEAVLFFFWSQDDGAVRLSGQ